VLKGGCWLVELETVESIIAGEPSISGSVGWQEADRALRSPGGLPGFITKMVIGVHDLYLKTDWKDGRIVRIDITLSRGHDTCDDLPKSERQVNLETTRFDLARSWVESECKMASDMLQSGFGGIGDVINAWVGVEGYPSGFCPQVVDPVSGGPTYQKSPLHAAAMLILARLPEWAYEMKMRQTEANSSSSMEGI